MGSFIGNDDLAEAKKVNALCPTEKVLSDAFPGKVERFHFVDGKKVQGEGPDGHYQWQMPYKPSLDGREGQKVLDLMRPYWKADSERQRTLQARRERIALKDESGSVNYVESHQAEQTANRNRWHSTERIVGLLARAVNGTFCPRCDRRVAWCECEES